MKVKIEKKIEQIAQIIGEHRTKDGSLLTGRMGHLIFLSEYNKYKGLPSEDFLFDEFSEIFDNIYGSNLLHTFCSGIAGVAWGTEYFVQKDLLSANTDEILGEVDRSLKQIVEMQLQENNIDYLHGATGLILYFLKKENSSDYKDVIEKYVCYLQDSAVKGEDGSIKWEVVLDDKTGLHGFNLGLSHGMPSIITVLCKIHEEKILQSQTAELIYGAIKYLLNQKFDKSANKISVFPNWVTGSGMPTESRLAWCYGDLGIAITLLLASKTLADERLADEAIAILEHSAQRLELKENLVNDAGFCHGSSGIAYIFRKAYDLTNKETFNQASEYWLNITLKMDRFQDGLAGYKSWYGPEGWINDYSLLEGLAGIGLVLLTFLSENKSNWDECLLLS